MKSESFGEIGEETIERRIEGSQKRAKESQTRGKEEKLRRLQIA